MKNIAVEKKTIRTNVKKIKEQMSLEEIDSKSKRILDKIVNLKQYKEAKNIFTYVNFNQEVVTTDLINISLKLNKNVFVPKIFNNEESYMDFIQIKSLGELKPGYFGVYEPVLGMEAVTRVREGFFVMPGIAFDYNFNRIGYGGGFYDRYLSNENNFFTVAVCYDFQLFEQVVSECHDLKPNMIITEQIIIKS